MSYFGIVVTEGYDWHQCYSWAWEVRTYWDTTRNGEYWSVHKAFPEVDWDDDAQGLMEQCIAICEGRAERPEKIFWEKKIIMRKK